MFIWKILTDLCLIRQNKKKNTFVDIVYKVIIAKEFWWNLERYV